MLKVILAELELSKTKLFAYQSVTNFGYSDWKNKIVNMDGQSEFSLQGTKKGGGAGKGC